MVASQVINKILQSKDFSIVINNDLSKQHFIDYEAEFDFIQKHYDKYGNIPDVHTFVDKFNEFEVYTVTESDTYLVDKIKEEYTYSKLIPFIKTAADKANNEDANVAIEFITNNIKNISVSKTVCGIDIIKDASHRLDVYKDKQNNKSNWFFKSGFDELDVKINGLQRGEELVLIFARTNQGKSWIAEKMAVSVWEQGYNVGFFSPEMSDISIGYRFDTLFKNYSNAHLTHGDKNDEYDSYCNYIENLQHNHTNTFLVTTPKDFDRRPSVSKFRSWIIRNDIHMLVIDGISYVHDDRYKHGDNTTTSLTNISEDLMSLSIELKIPIIIVAQANREAAGEEKTSAPTLETVRNSDGMAHNASKVFSIRNKDSVLEILILKQRNGEVGNKFLYNWDINNGKFTYVPNPKAGLPDNQDTQLAQHNKDMFNDDKEAIY